jgi:ribosomal protein L13
VPKSTWERVSQAAKDDGQAEVRGKRKPVPTYIPKADAIERRWFVIDASGQVLGKVATKAASLLTGKAKPIYTPFLDTGDHVVVINADAVVLTGNKETDKVYRHHSGYLGGLKSRAAKDVARSAAQDRRRGDPRDAAEDQARARDVPEAQGLRRRQAPAPGPEAPAAQPVGAERKP